MKVLSIFMILSTNQVTKELTDFQRQKKKKKSILIKKVFYLIIGLQFYAHQFQGKLSNNK